MPRQQYQILWSIQGVSLCQSRRQSLYRHLIQQRQSGSRIDPLYTIVWKQTFLLSNITEKHTLTLENRVYRPTGYFDTLVSPLLQPNWAPVHTKTIYFQDPISIPDYHASFQNYSAIYLLQVLWFMCQGRAHFHEHFLTVFLGWLSKNDHKIVNTSNWIRLLYHNSF